MKNVVLMTSDERNALAKKPYRAEHNIISRFGDEGEKLLMFLSNGIALIELENFGDCPASFELIKILDEKGNRTAIEPYYRLTIFKETETIGEATYSFEKQWEERYCLHIYSIKVPLKYQRKGIGSAILRKLEEVARQSHSETVNGTIAPVENLPEFYRKNGYTIDNDPDRHKLYFIKPVHEDEAQ